MTYAVYVLGAGSSVCARGPLVNEFKEVALQAVNSMPEGRGKSRMLATLGHWEGTVPGANVEEYYVLVDLLHRLGPPAFRDPFGIARVENAKYLIAKTLQIAMGTEVSRVHADFRKNLVEAPGRNGVVISLNWDIAYDRAVATVYGPRSLNLGYSKAEPVGGDGGENQQAAFSLFKLHGSSNWWFCKDCHTLWYTAGKKGVTTHWELNVRQRCTNAECHGALTPLMIPPTSQKFESSEFSLPLTEIWGKARVELTRCSEVYFVGYSFPAADVQFRMLAVEALLSNPRLRTLTVVTSPKFGSERAVFEDRYSAVFSAQRLRNKLRFLYEAFEDWVTAR
jgi:hypothetical protein